jgi:hypothetical protein
MRKLSTFIFLIVILFSGAAIGEPVTVEVYSQKEDPNLSELDIQSFDLTVEGLWTNNELEEEMKERTKNYFESTGLSFRDNSKSGLLIGVLFNGFTIYGNDLPGIKEWTKQSEDKSAIRSITVHVIAPPRKDVPIRIWTGWVKYQGHESDIQGLARVMLDELLNEYPNGSKEPEVREVIVPE